MNAGSVGAAATMTVSKNGTDDVQYRITYSVTVQRTSGSDGPIPLCNSASVDDGTPVSEDTECACPDNYMYCPLDDRCIPEGDTCGGDKSIIAINGDTITYQIV